MKSKYAGNCKVCSGPYAKGSMIMWAPGKGAAHAQCAEGNPPAPPIYYFRENGMLELNFPYHAGHIAAVKSIPGKTYDPTFQTWMVPDTPFAWNVLGDHLVDGDEAAISIKKTLEVSDSTAHPDYPYLMKHQAQIVNTAITGHKKLYLGLPAGTGKSLSSFASMDALGAYPLLIVCLSINKVNWQRELKKFAGLESQILESRTPSPITENIAIINYDILPAWEDQLAQHGFKGVIFDESAYIKNPDAKRTKASSVVAKKSEAIMMLSGTPVPSSPHDLIAPLTILGEIKKWGGKKKFIDRYCPPVMTKFGVTHSQYTNLDELHQNLKNSCFIAWTKEDLIDLPGLSVYDEFVDGESVTLKAILKDMNAGTRAEAVRVLNDFEQGTDEMFAKMRSETGSAKIKAIVDEAAAVAEYEKVIVGVHHRDVNDEVTKALSKKFKTVQIIGGMGDKKRQASIDAFQDGDAQVMVMSIVAAGVAINLQNASHMILGELPPSYAEFDQVISRIYRSGQKKKVTIKRLIAPATVDAILVGLSSKKEGLHNAVMAGQATESVNIKEELIKFLVNRKKEQLEN